MALALSPKLPHLPVDAPQPAKLAETQFHLLLLVTGVGAGALLQTWGPAWTKTIFEQVRLDSFNAVLALLLAFVASILGHEAGHLLAALYLNYEILGAAIGPLQMEPWNGRIPIRLEKGKWSRCSISAVPRDLDDRWRVRMMIVVASGPFASLLLLLASTCAALGGSSASELTSFWSCCSEVNLFLFLLGLVPNGRFSSVRNDSALFLALWRNNADARDMFVCHQAIELSLSGIRPDDFPESLLREWAAFEGRRPYTRLMIARRMVEWAVDSGNIQLAGEWDQAALAASRLCSPRLANRALAESACFDLVFNDDLPEAARKFAEVEFAGLFPPPLAERAMAAHLVARDLPHRAPAHILRAQYQLPLGNPYYNYERMWLGRLHSKALLARTRPISH